MMSIVATLYQRWLGQCDGASVSLEKQQKEWEALLSAYTQPHRAYHNLHHIHALFRDLSQFSTAEVSESIQWAIWYHDIVYDPHAGDNEEQSADWAVTTLQNWGLSSSLQKEVRRLILATQSHQAEADDHNACLLLDLDLGILGTSSERYAEYARAIREEYRWVPRPLYAQGRQKVLDSFLSLKTLYNTPVIRQQREQRGQENLRWERALWEEEGFDFADRE
jgi:predicted metal-dependent HD superfamily phosphohydrolase